VTKQSVWDFIQIPDDEDEEFLTNLKEDLPIEFQLLPVFPSPKTFSEFEKAYQLMHPIPGCNPQIIWP
jgi:hypothetical protein